MSGNQKTGRGGSSAPKISTFFIAGDFSPINEPIVYSIAKDFAVIARLEAFGAPITPEYPALQVFEVPYGSLSNLLDEADGMDDENSTRIGLKISRSKEGTWSVRVFLPPKMRFTGQEVLQPTFSVVLVSKTSAKHFNDLRRLQWHSISMEEHSVLLIRHNQLAEESGTVGDLRVCFTSSWICKARSLQGDLVLTQENGRSFLKRCGKKRWIMDDDAIIGHLMKDEQQRLNERTVQYAALLSRDGLCSLIAAALPSSMYLTFGDACTQLSAQAGSLIGAAELKNHAIGFVERTEVGRKIPAENSLMPQYMAAPKGTSLALSMAEKMAAFSRAEVADLLATMFVDQKATWKEKILACSASAKPSKSTVPEQARNLLELLDDLATPQVPQLKAAIFQDENQTWAEKLIVCGPVSKLAKSILPVLLGSSLSAGMVVIQFVGQGSKKAPPLSDIVPQMSIPGVAVLVLQLPDLDCLPQVLRIGASFPFVRMLRLETVNSPEAGANLGPDKQPRLNLEVFKKVFRNLKNLTIPPEIPLTKNLEPLRTLKALTMPLSYDRAGLKYDNSWLSYCDEVGCLKITVQPALDVRHQPVYYASQPRPPTTALEAGRRLFGILQAAEALDILSDRTVAPKLRSLALDGMTKTDYEYLFTHASFQDRVDLTLLDNNEPKSPEWMLLTMGKEAK